MILSTKPLLIAFLFVTINSYSQQRFFAEKAIVTFFSDAVVELSADVTSIDTDNASRDEHLRGTNYFDAATFPALTFKSKSFTKISDKKYKLTGDLTIKGVTKTVDLEVTYIGSTTNPKTQKRIAGFKITGKINRIDFGVGTSSATLGDEVTITANVEVIKD